MKKFVSLLYVLCLFGLVQHFSCVHARQILKNRMAWLVQERIDGKVFTHKVHIKEGARVDEWSIDDEPVSCDEYEEAILDAEKQERRLERRQEERARIQDYEFKQKAQRTVSKKLFKNVLVGIERIIADIEKYTLHQYFAYADDTIVSQYDYMQLTDTLLPQARSLMEQGDVELEELIASTQQLQGYEQRLQSFLQATIDNAIDKCDDTKVLKDLLALVAA